MGVRMTVSISAIGSESRSVRRSLVFAGLTAVAALATTSSALGTHAPISTNCFYANTSCAAGITGGSGWVSSWGAFHNANSVRIVNTAVPYLLKKAWAWPAPSGPSLGPWNAGSGFDTFAVQVYSSTGTTIKGKCGNGGSSAQAFKCSVQVSVGH